MENPSKKNLFQQSFEEITSPPSEEEVRDSIDLWNKVTQKIQEQMLSKDEVDEIIKNIIKLQKDPNSLTPNIPAQVKFDSPRRFYIIYRVFFGEERAKQIVIHELAHDLVWRNNGVNVEWGIIVSKVEGGQHFRPLVSARFPDDMNLEERLRISKEATIAVDDPSDLDDYQNQILNQ